MRGNPIQASSNEAAGSTENTDGVEVKAVVVEDPCTCFEKGLSRGQLRYCRESKRDVSFSRPCANVATGEVDGVSAIDKMPGDGQYTMNPKVTVVQWKGEKLGMTETGTVPIRSCILSIQERPVGVGQCGRRNERR